MQRCKILSQLSHRPQSSIVSEQGDDEAKQDKHLKKEKKEKRRLHLRMLLRATKHGVSWFVITPYCFSLFFAFFCCCCGFRITIASAAREHTLALMLRFWKSFKYGNVVFFFRLNAQIKKKYNKKTFSKQCIIWADCIPRCSPDLLTLHVGWEMTRETYPLFFSPRPFVMD